jgi:hypothetical protein
LEVYRSTLDDPKIYEDGFDTNLPEGEEALTAQRRNLLFNCLQQAWGYHSGHKWAHPSLVALLKGIYKQQSQFSPSDLKEISRMINAIGNNIASNGSLDSTRLHRDDGIKKNPLEAGVKVSDARDVKLSTGGFDSWNAKQSGLTYGKLTFNK